MSEDPEREFAPNINAELALLRAQQILEDKNIPVEDRCALAAEWREMSDSWAARFADAYVLVEDEEKDDDAAAEREPLTNG